MLTSQLLRLPTRSYVGSDSLSSSQSSDFNTGKLIDTLIHVPSIYPASVSAESQGEATPNAQHARLLFQAMSLGVEISGNRDGDHLMIFNGSPHTHPDKSVDADPRARKPLAQIGMDFVRSVTLGRMPLPLDVIGVTTATSSVGEVKALRAYLEAHRVIPRQIIHVLYQDQIEAYANYLRGQGLDRFENYFCVIAASDNDYHRKPIQRVLNALVTFGSYKRSTGEITEFLTSYRRPGTKTARIIQLVWKIFNGTDIRNPADPQAPLFTLPPLIARLMRRALQ